MTVVLFQGAVSWISISSFITTSIRISYALHTLNTQLNEKILKTTTKTCHLENTQS